MRKDREPAGTCRSKTTHVPTRPQPAKATNAHARRASNKDWRQSARNGASWQRRGTPAGHEREPTTEPTLFFPQIWSEPSERAVDEEDRRSSPDGRRPAVARPPPVGDGWVPRPGPSPAYGFFPPRWGE